MMKLILQLFGNDKDLNALQMTDRAIIVFFIALALIRISGRRSFGMRSPLDNIIVILLGAILSRAVAAASPFIPTVAASFAIVVLHRLFALFAVSNDRPGRLIKGEKIVLYEKGKFVRENMNKSLVSEKDIREGVRIVALVDSLDKIEAVYMERNGQISAIKSEDAD